MRVPLGAIQGLGKALLPNAGMMSADQAGAFQSNDVTVSLAAVKAAFPGAVSWFYDVDGVPIVDYGDHEVRLSCTWPDAMPYTAQYGMSLSRPLPNGQSLYLMQGCPAPSGYGATPAGFGMNVSTVTPEELAASARSTAGRGVTQTDLTGPSLAIHLPSGHTAPAFVLPSFLTNTTIGTIPNWVLLLLAVGGGVYFMGKR